MKYGGSRAGRQWARAFFRLPSPLRVGPVRGASPPERLQWLVMAERNRPGDGADVAVPRARTRKKSARPPLFKVLLHNDDFTTQEFVDWVLVTVFRHDAETAHRIMLNVHMHGVGVAGIYPREIAEHRAEKVMTLAREAEFPLLCTIEPE
jgi:ATP-dependent Clp protease adaptor protein ClpS